MTINRQGEPARATYTLSDIRLPIQSHAEPPELPRHESLRLTPASRPHVRVCGVGP